MYCKKCNNKAFHIERNDGDFYYCENCKEIKESDVDKGIAHLYIGRQCKVGDLIDEYNKNAK